MKKIEDIFNWFGNFENNIILLRSKSKNFYIKIGRENLPHLLGLQYYNKNPKKIVGNNLYNVFHNNINYNMEIENFYKRVEDLHGKQKRINVYNRIDTFKTFMENLDKASIVENTHINKGIKAQYFAILNGKDDKVSHLGILETNNMDIVLDYNISNINVLNTYIVQNNDNYYGSTSIYEPIQDILFYNEDLDRYIPGSFNIEKNNILKDCYLSNFKENNQESLNNIDFSKKRIYQYQGFNFIPLRTLTDFESNMSIKDISKYLKTDGLFSNGIGKVEEFYNDINTEADLFYNIETGNVYIPTENGMMKWELEDEETISLLENTEEKENELFEEYDLEEDDELEI